MKNSDEGHAVTHRDEPERSRLIVISPVKDEAEYLQKTIASMTAQTHRPGLWIIVDDGSTDDTGAIAEAAAREQPWIRVVHRMPGEQRRVGPGVIEAFYDGLDTVDIRDFDFVCKLDGDLEFAPAYFAELLRRFAADPALGTASGKSWIAVGGRLVPERSGSAFSLGAAKLYRRTCFEAIGGFERAVMWDGIDCHRCRQLGWKAVSYDNPGLAILHLRPMGSSFRNIYHGRLRWGRGQYFMGTHPVYLAGITVYRMFERPWVLGGLCILAGYVGAWWRRQPRYDAPEFRRFLHRWQFQELARQCLGGLAPRPVAEAEKAPSDVVPAVTAESARGVDRRASASRTA